MVFCGEHAVYCSFSWFICLLSWTVLLPASVYRSLQLWKRRQTVMLYARHIEIESRLLFPSLLFFATVTCPLLLLSASAGSYGNVHLFRLINSVALQISAGAFFWKIAFASLNKELSWQSLIVTDDKLTESNAVRKSIYIKWRATWLSPFRMAVFLGVYQCIAIITIVSLYAANLDAWAAANGTFLMLELILAVYSWYHTPKLVDSFKIRFEIKLMCVAGVVVFISWVLIWVIGLFIVRDSWTGSPLDQLLTVFSVWSLAVSVIYIITQLRWELLPDEVKTWNRTTQKLVLREHQDMMRMGSQDSTHDVTHSAFTAQHVEKMATVSTVKDLWGAAIGSAHAHTDDTNGRLSQPSFVDQIRTRLFSHPDCVTLFAEFLALEFSIENLIGLIEWHQYATSMLNMISEEEEDNFSFLSQILIPSSVVPLSTINSVNSKGGCRSTWIYRFFLLCEKYVGDRAKYALNLPYGLTESLIKLRNECLEKTDLRSEQEELEFTEKIVRHSADTVRELVSLCKDSFSRFVNNPLYSKFSKVQIE